MKNQDSPGFVHEPIFWIIRVRNPHQHMNCLLTAIGSISAEAAILSLRKNNVSRIVGCDTNPYSWIPVSSLVDVFYRVPHTHENQNYLDKLIEIINREKIDHVIPLTDTEVDLLSARRDDFTKYNVTLCISGEKSIRICRDKLAVYEFFKDDNNIHVIPTFLPSQFPLCDYPFPVLAKPRRGRSSEGVTVIDDSGGLGRIVHQSQDYIVQPFLTGDVFAVDFVRNRRTRKSVSIARKELIRTVNGAGLSVEMAFNQTLMDMTRYIGDKLDLNGCMNMEFLFKGHDYFLMDINPRFSAGVSFSILAGYDMVFNHIRCFTPGDIQDPVVCLPMIITRKYTDVITEGGK
jgi:carbamoyl-phosphate synthase large subunit